MITDFDNIEKFNNKNIKMEGLTRDNPTFDFIKKSTTNDYVAFKIEEKDGKYRFVFIDKNNNIITDRWNKDSSFKTRMIDFAWLSEIRILDNTNAKKYLEYFIDGKFHDLTIAKKNFKAIYENGDWNLMNGISKNTWFEEWMKPRINHMVMISYYKLIGQQLPDYVKKLKRRNAFDNLWNVINQYVVDVLTKSDNKEVIQLNSKKYEKLTSEIDKINGIGHLDVSISELYEMTREARITVPSFQREYIWKTSQITNLLNSIIKGYPIGSLLATSAFERFNIKNIIIKSIAQKKWSKKSWFILDGQQRITSILMVIDSINLKRKSGNILNKDLSVELKRLENIYYYDGKFYNRKIENVPKAEYDKYSILYNHNVASEVNEKLSSYKIPVTFLGEEYKNDLIDIFSVINIGSQKLSNVDLIHSVLFSTSNKDNEIDLHESFKTLNQNSIIKQFNYDKELIVQIWRLIGSYQSDKFKKISLSSKEILEEATNEVGFDEMFFNAGTFLENLLIEISKILEKECGFYSFKEIPNKAFVIMTAVYILEKGFIYGKFKFDSNEYIKMISVVMMKSIDKRYSSATFSKITSDINDYRTRTFKFPKQIDSIIENEILDYNSKSTLYKLSISYLRLLNPVSLLDGETLVNVLGDKHDEKNSDQHHFVPKKMDQKNFVNKLDNELLNSIGNIALISENENRKEIKARSPYDYFSNKDKKQIHRIARTHAMEESILTKINELNEGDDTLLRDFIIEREKKIIQEVKNKWLNFSNNSAL